MKRTEKAAADVATIDDGRRDQTRVPDLPKEQYITRATVVQVVRYFLPSDGEKGWNELWHFLMMIHGKSINTNHAPPEAQEALRLQEVLESAKT